MVSISSTIAKQVGNLEGKLISQIEGQVLVILKKFSNQCPSSEELQKIIKVRNTLIRHLTSFQKRVGKLTDVARRLESAIRTVSLAIKIITSIPVPTSVPPGVGIPISILTKYSNALIKLNKTLDKLTEEAASIRGITSSIIPTISSLKTRLESIDTLIQKCSENSSVNLLTILDTAQPRETIGSKGILNEDYQYKGYTLAILQDLSTSKIAPRRYATATDSRGIVVLKGPLSFSSSTQVLLDEIKFRIDNKLA